MIAYFVRHPTAANLLMLAILTLGLMALPQLQRDTFPVLPVSEVEVRIAYPGGRAEEVEAEICAVLEPELEVVDNLDEIRCDARENLAISTVSMHPSADIDRFYNDISAAVSATDALPEQAEIPQTRMLDRSATVASVAISGPMSEIDLWKYAESVRQRLLSNPSLSEINLQGISAPQIEIHISLYDLQRFGLTLTQLTDSIRSQSLDSPAGILGNEANEYLVSFSGEKRRIGEFNNLIIGSSPTGAEIRLGQIARIQQRFAVPEERVEFNGQQAAILEVVKTAKQDALKVKQKLDELLQGERRRAPQGVTLKISGDTTGNIRDRLRLISSNGMGGIVLVFLSMWAFFSLRYSFWVSMGLPVSFLGAIFCMNLLGYSLNMITMVALLVAIGILMDDAIVIAENIATKMQQGHDAAGAAIEGVQQVLPGVFSSFLTTIMIVGPLAFLSGKMGDVLKFLPAVLVITLAVSLIEAFLILPAHLYHSLRKNPLQHSSRLHQTLDSGFLRIRDRAFMPLLRRVLRHAPLSVGVLVLLLLLSIATFPAGWLKYSAFPDLESDVIEARLLYPQGTPLTHTEEGVQQVLAALQQLDQDFSPRQKEAQALIRNTSVFYNRNVDANESGPHLATISADLLRAENRNGSIPEMLAHWKTLSGDVPGVLQLKFTDRERGVAGKAIEVRLQGQSLEALKAASLDLQQWLKGFKGVTHISDDLRSGKPEYRVSLKPGAHALGVQASTVAAELRAALNGKSGISVQGKWNSMDVLVKLDPNNRQWLEDLYRLPIKTRNGSAVALGSVAQIEEDRGFARIHRVNGKRTVTVSGSIDTRLANSRDIMNMSKKKFFPEFKKRHPKVKLALKGQASETEATGNSLATNLLIGLAGMYLILSLQFRSWFTPLAVMLAIPMALIGVIGGHLLLSLPLTMPSLVGLATLAGIVVNNNILLVNFIRQALANGSSLLDAVSLAAHSRFRAILLTSLTTVAGLLPMLLETSTQAQLLIPMVASLVFGLSSATLLSLFLVPALFIAFSRQP